MPRRLYESLVGIGADGLHLFNEIAYELWQLVVVGDLQLDHLHPFGCPHLARQRLLYVGQSAGGPLAAVEEVALVIELEDLGGRKRLRGYDVFSLVQY